jgi:hypothetical protein
MKITEVTCVCLCAGLALASGCSTVPEGEVGRTTLSQNVQNTIAKAKE